MLTTVILIVSVSVAPAASVTVTTTVCTPTFASLGVPESVAVDDPAV